jgi:hypothetical protein
MAWLPRKDAAPETPGCFGELASSVDAVTGAAIGPYRKSRFT